MSIVGLKVNGRAVSVDVPDPSAPLLFILRNDLDLHGPRFGCGLGQCGSCTVIMGGKAVRSCITPVGSVKEPITTLEGLVLLSSSTQFKKRGSTPRRFNAVTA